MDVKDIWLERCKQIRDLPESWSGIEGASRHDSLSPDPRDAVVIDCVLMNGMPALLQHPYFFGYNYVFSTGVLILIMSDENLHGCLANASEL